VRFFRVGAIVLFTLIFLFFFLLRVFLLFVDFGAPFFCFFPFCFFIVSKKGRFEYVLFYDPFSPFPPKKPRSFSNFFYFPSAHFFNVGLAAPLQGTQSGTPPLVLSPIWALPRNAVFSTFLLHPPHEQRSCPRPARIAP